MATSLEVRKAMATEISWLEDWNQALQSAQAQDKSIFLDFFSPT